MRAQGLRTEFFIRAMVKFEPFSSFAFTGGERRKSGIISSFTQGCVRCADFTLGYHMSPLRGFR